MEGLSNILPFEDNAFLDITPIYIKIAHPKNKEDEKYLYTGNGDEFYSRWYRRNRAEKWIKISQNCIYYIHDFASGEDTPCSILDFYKVVNDKFRGRKEIRTMNRSKSSSYVYSQEIINNMPVFRFYYFAPNYINENNKIQGYFETHRIWYQDEKFWVETRDGNVKEYKQGRNSVYRYKYSLIKNKQINFYNLYPWLYLSFWISDSSRNLHDYYFNKLYETRLERECNCKEFYKDIPTKESKEIFLSFFDFYNAITKYNFNGIYKNTPLKIVEDLKKSRPCCSVNKRKKLENKVDLFIYKYAYSYLCNSDKKIKIIAETLSDNLCRYRYFYFDFEVIRIYFDNKKSYKFIYDFNNFWWTSTKSSKIMYHSVNVNWKVTPNNTILNRIDINGFDNEYILYYSELIPKYVVLEQLAKMRYKHLLNSFILNAGWGGYLNFLYSPDFKKARNAKSIGDWINFKAKNLKLLRDPNFSDFIEVNNKVINMSKKYFKKDEVLTLNVIECINYNFQSFDRIRRLYGKDLDGLYDFFRVLVKRGNASNEIGEYLDYLDMINDANKLARHHFEKKIKPKDIKIMHKRIVTDYNDYQKIKYELQNKKLEEKFKNVIEQDEYKQFLYEDDNFIIVNPVGTYDLIREGSTLHHCVGSYRHRMANNNSFIYFIRKKESPELPYFTMEIVPERMTSKTGKKTKTKFIITQIFGEYDKVIDDENLRTFINNFKKLHKKEIKKCEYWE